jgi:hypothetical protein
MDTIFLLLAVLSVYLLVKSICLVVSFNRRMPELWNLLETSERSHRVRKIHIEAWSNLPAARYLYDNTDFEVPEIRELKLALKRLHRSAITNLLLFMVTSTAAVLVWL